MPVSKEKLTEKPVVEKAVGFGFQGGKKPKDEAVYVVEEQIRTELKDTRLSLSITKSANVISPTHVALRRKYRIERYDLHPGHVFPEAVQSLLPRNTPEYIDKGFN